MMHKLFLVVILCLLFGMNDAKAIQESTGETSDKGRNLSKYEKFLNKSGSFILSKTYHVGQHKEGSGYSTYSVEAITAWDMDSSERVYAARFASIIVDYTDLGEFQQELDKIIQSVEKVAEKPDAPSMRYRSLNGLEFAYFTNELSGKPQHITRLTVRGICLADDSMISVLELRTLISQVREKLITLGAK